MLKMQYLFLSNLPKPDGVFDQTFVPLIMSLRNVHKRRAAIPNSKLWVKFNFFAEGATLHIEKGKDILYVKVYCIHGKYAATTMCKAVQKLYQTYNFGIAQMPMAENWIHSVPVNYNLLSQQEVRLAENISIAFYWNIYAKTTRESNPLN